MFFNFNYQLILHFSCILIFNYVQTFHFCSEPAYAVSSTPAPEAVGGGTTTGTDGAFFMYWKYAPRRRPIMATIIKWYILYPSDFDMDAPLPPLLTAWFFMFRTYFDVLSLCNSVLSLYFLLWASLIFLAIGTPSFIGA